MARTNNPVGDIARAFAHAPIVHTDAAPADTPVAAQPTDTGKLHMPSFSFRLVADPKSYTDRNNAAKTSSRIAYVDLALPNTPITLAASIYLETLIEQTPDGRHERKMLRFSLPKGIELRADMNAADMARVDDWKETVVDAYVDWRKSSGANVAGSERRQKAGTRVLAEVS